MKRPALILFAALAGLAGCHNIPRVNADEITSDITTPVFSHKIVVKGLIADSCPVPEPEPKP